MNGEGGGQVNFREVQRFNDFWLWALIILVSAYTLYISGVQMYQGMETVSQSMPFWVGVLVGICLPLLIGMCNLTTEIREDGVYFKFFPFHVKHRKILFSKIKSFEAITYRPIRDYGGWGIRYGRKGLAYNISGNRGVLFELSNGRTILLGSREADKFAAALAEIGFIH